MADLVAQIRAKLTLHDTGESTVQDMRCAYDCEMTQAALLAVLELHKPERQSAGTKVWDDCATCRDTGWNGPEVPWPCDTVEAIAKALEIEVTDD